MPVHILDDIIRQIVLATAASNAETSGITLRSAEALLQRAFAEIITPKLALRCAAELHLSKSEHANPGALSELTELVLTASEPNRTVEPRLEAARDALKRLTAICLLITSSAAPRLDLLIDDAHVLDYIHHVTYQPKGQGRVVLVGRLCKGDDDILIGSDPHVRGLDRISLCYSSVSPWPLLTVAQRVYSARAGGRLGLTKESQSCGEADDLTLSTDVRIKTRLRSVPYSFPIPNSTIRLTVEVALRLVVTQVLAPNNAVIATFLRPTEPAALPPTC